MTPTPIIIDGPEQSRLDPDRADGGLLPAVGVRSYQVFRASRDVPELSDGRGWTYHHHVDMATWKGLLYVGWNSCEKDEDTWPSRELFSTSTDGQNWSAPRELFPQGVSTPLRMYFYLAANGRMLAIAGLRLNCENTDEDLKGGMVVREILANHDLGPVHTLQLPPGGKGRSGEAPTTFEKSSDSDFIAACRQLLDDNVFLEQQDRGRLLGDRRMIWHNASAWPGGKVPGDSEKWVAGKAFSFFHRADGTLVGISKMGWTTTSIDDGKTWSQPTIPPTLITGKAKVWSQRTRDRRYALVYNPSTKHRYPLIVVTGEDGTHFSHMRLVQGELPIQRYEGKFRSIGPQYGRGVSAWSDDGSRAAEGAMWLVYSISKEDIWVSRVSVPVQSDAPGLTGDEERFDNWNVYSPKWSPITFNGYEIQLTDGDPYDYARAVRLFADSPAVTVSFEISSNGSPGRSMECELISRFNLRPVRITLEPDKVSQWTHFRIAADCLAGRYSVWRNEELICDQIRFAEIAGMISRLSIRTGAYRDVDGTHPVTPGSDRPLEKPVIWRLRRVHIKAGT